MKEENLNRLDAIRYIRERCDGKPLAKLADEYNYVKYTLKLIDKKEEKSTKRQEEIDRSKAGERKIRSKLDLEKTFQAFKAMR